MSNAVTGSTMKIHGNGSGIARWTRAGRAIFLRPVPPSSRCRLWRVSSLQEHRLRGGLAFFVKALWKWVTAALAAWAITEKSGSKKLSHAHATSTFYRLGRAVGIEALREMALRFGFGSGRRSGLFLGNEVLESLGVPMRSGFHEARPVLGPGDSVSDAMRLAIGQAPLDDVTPLQIATMMGAVGTGTLRPPSLVAELEGYPPIPARGGRSLGIPEGSLAVVRDGMAAVMDSEMGTGRRLNEQLKESAPWLVGKIAAKTGTAQVGGHQDQSWFAGYLPRDTPRLAFAVLIEDCGLHGSEAAAPTFGLLLEKPVMQSFLAEEILTPPGGRR